MKNNALKMWISIAVILSLVVSFGAMMTGCKGKKADEDTTTESVTETTSESFDDSLQGFLEELESERREYSTVEHTTDEHYEEDFEALTLPPAAPAAATTKRTAGTTKAAAATTAAQTVHRETTTQFQFTSPSRAPSTTKANSTTSAAGSTTAATTTTTTTKKDDTQANSSQTDVSSTMEDRIPDAYIPSNPTEIQRPNVTYLDKYVVQVLQSGSYTIQTELRTDGAVIPMTTYSNADNFAIKMSMGPALADMMNAPVSFGKLGEIRLITKNMNSDPHVYIAWTGGYTELEGEGTEGIKDLFMDAEEERSMLSAMQFDALVYCGFETREGYLVETYKVPEDNQMYCFYFDSQGLAKWIIKDMDSNSITEEIVVKLTAGVSDKNAFKVSGKKYSMEEMENLFGGVG